MTTYDFAIPLIGLGLGALAVAYVKWLNWRFHRDDARSETSGTSDEH
ncbi:MULTISPECIES: hypothetical protein [unclassified Roseovarius]|nr:hypothetical protein [Roseovarius sp. MMSF_3350]